MGSEEGRLISESSGILFFACVSRVDRQPLDVRVTPIRFSMFSRCLVRSVSMEFGVAAQHDYMLC